MEDSVRKKLREDLEYWHTNGEATQDEFSIGTEVSESDYEVAEDLRYAKVRKEVMGMMNSLIEANIPAFGDRDSAMGAVLSVIEKLYL